MSTLVQFLAAGVNGAASGTATFLLRGTASSAAAVLYNDFERTAQPGTNVITLDANGSAEVYCSAYVDVAIRNSAGTLLRTVTVGNSSSVVEVRSDSFTGTDYDGSPANTVNQPVTLTDVLNRWNDSAGASNFQVLVDGVATNLQSAVVGFAGMFINVKDPQYGATGDGVTDDTTAILAATTDAAGGIVFFPPGTYKITTLSLSGANINWMGSGAGASIISGTTSTDMIALTDNTSTGRKNFRGLSFTSSGTYARLFALEESQNVSFDGCVLDGTNCSATIITWSSAAGLSKAFFTDCDFSQGASTPNGLLNSAATGRRAIFIEGCNFAVPVGFTGNIIAGADFNMSGCRFDASAVVSGTYRHINAEDQTVTGKYVGVFNGNQFLDGGSTGFVFKLTGLSSACNFSEDGNTFIGFTAPDATLEKGQTYEITDAESGIPGHIHLGSRKGRTVHISAAADVVASACLEAEDVVIEMAASTAIGVTVPALIPGLTGRVTAFRAAASADTDVGFVDSAGFGVRFTHDGQDGAVIVSGGSNQACSCAYSTTVRADGTYRSLIISEAEHHN